MKDYARIKKANERKAINHADAETLEYKRATIEDSISFGKGGRSGENDVTRLVSCNNSVFVISNRIGYDFYKIIDGKRVYFEVKTCLSTIGEIILDENYNETGETFFPALEYSDYMVYSMDYLPTMDDETIKNSFFVVPVNEFFEFMKTAKKDRRVYPALIDENGNIVYRPCGKPKQDKSKKPIGRGQGVTFQLQSMNYAKTVYGGKLTPYGESVKEFLESYPTLAEFFNI